MADRTPTVEEALAALDELAGEALSSLGACTLCSHVDVIRLEFHDLNCPIRIIAAALARAGAEALAWTESGRRPCPFCGSRTITGPWVDAGEHYLYCDRCGIDGPAVPNVDDAEGAWNRREGAEASSNLTLPGHKCETILDLSRHMADGSEVGGHSRIWRLGKLTEPIEGAPAERWCWHYRTAWKPEIVFGLNEADMNYLTVMAFAALGYHTSERWIEALAGKRNEGNSGAEARERAPHPADWSAFHEHMAASEEWPPVLDALWRLAADGMAGQEDADTILSAQEYVRARLAAPEPVEREPPERVDGWAARDVEGRLWIVSPTPSEKFSTAVWTDPPLREAEPVERDQGEEFLLTEVKRVRTDRDRLRRQIALSAQALVAQDTEEAYHRLYEAADPHFQNLEGDLFDAWLPAPEPQEEREPDGVSMIAAERRRQIEVEVWTPEHDDDHADAELAVAALAYLDGAVVPRHNTGAAHSVPPDYWPWAGSWWKPKDQIRDLVKAGALIAAEIDRLRRAAPEPREEA